MADLRTGSLSEDQETSFQTTEDGIREWDKDCHVTSTKKVLPLPEEVQGTKPQHVQVFCCKIPRRILNSLLAVLTLFFSVGINVTLPIFATATVKAGGDPFDVFLINGMFFPFIFLGFLIVWKFTVNPSQKLLPFGCFKASVLAGFLMSLGGLMLVSASPAFRTPPYLQGILTTTVVPFTVVFRFLLLRKGISFRRLVCTGVVLIGLFISIEPQIWNLEGSGSDSSSGGQEGAGRILWPMCFALGFVPAALVNISVEKTNKREGAESLLFITWVQVFQSVFVFSLFWTDFIPGFGNVDSIQKFGTNLATTLKCTFSSSPNCFGIAYKSWIFILCYCNVNLFSFLLIEYAEGAVYVVIVQALVTPLATLFWTVFKATPSFHWGPEFTMTTGFTLVGLAIISPAVLMYNYFSNKEAALKSQSVQKSHPA